MVKKSRCRRMTTVKRRAAKSKGFKHSIKNRPAGKLFAVNARFSGECIRRSIINGT